MLWFQLVGAILRFSLLAPAVNTLTPRNGNRSDTFCGWAIRGHYWNQVNEEHQIHVFVL
jgi:hypothetical protein